MRVISGIYKGRRLQSGNDLSIRPTTDRVKEYIFNILQDFPENICVADIFAGSGNLGIEALSRGAHHVVFVEKSIKSIQVLKKNIAGVGIDASSYSILNLSANDFVKYNHKNIMLYLLDPPFNYPSLQFLIDSLITSDNFHTGNLLVLEHEVSNPIILTDNDNYRVLKQKKMGRSLISFLEKGAIYEG